MIERIMTAQTKASVVDFVGTTALVPKIKKESICSDIDKNT